MANGCTVLLFCPVLTFHRILSVFFANYINYIKIGFNQDFPTRPRIYQAKLKIIDNRTKT